MPLPDLLGGRGSCSRKRTPWDGRGFYQTPANLSSLLGWGWRLGMDFLEGPSAAAACFSVSYNIEGESHSPSAPHTGSSLRVDVRGGGWWPFRLLASL